MRPLVRAETSLPNHSHNHKALRSNLETPLQISLTDNTASITMSNDLGLPHKRSKHFGIEFSFFKQSVILKEILPVFVSTDDQPADMLTKTLLPSKFIKFRDMVMGGVHLQNYFANFKN